MAIDNLNYLSSGLPAGQLTDKYSNLPGCLKSKNLDIFSSSKSVKATAFSAPVAGDNDVIAEEGGLVLKTDGKVYERTALGDTLLVDPSIDFPVYKVCYTGKNGDYDDAERGTPTAMSVATAGDEWRSFVVFTDRASFVYSKIKYTPKKTWRSQSENIVETGNVTENGYEFRQTVRADRSCTVSLNVDPTGFTSWKLKLYAIEDETDGDNISLAYVKLYGKPKGYYYDPAADDMRYTDDTFSAISLPFSGSITDGIVIDVPSYPNSGQNCYIQIGFNFTQKAGASTYGWLNGKLYIDFNGGPNESHVMSIGGVSTEGDFNSYYTYLPIRERKLVDIGVYGYSQTYWMKGTTYQYLYKWVNSFVELGGETKVIYDFVTDMGRPTDPDMDVIGLIIWNEQVYMIGNLNGNGYIIPCDLTGGVGTPYIAYGCTFTGVANIDYLLYLVGENRGISNLWVYNGQELVSVIGGNKEKTYNDIIDLDEQYKFDGKIVNWRKNLILSTSDNRLFQYGQTYGGKGGAFIHQLPSNATITGLRANGNDLEVEYSITESGTTTNYKIKYQDDTPIKNYNTEWEATYPIVIGNHFLEKEESDLYASYVIPHSSCKLEFWGNANHYTYWSFKVTSNFTPPAGSLWDIQGLANGLVLVTSRLEFVEKNGEWLTFRLVGEMPVMSGNETGRIIYKTKNSDYYLDYTEVNHFRKIGEITADKFTEGEFRFHNLNNKLELPKSHSLQIMVRGKGTANYTPELFSLDLVANQRDRG